ncbi:MAG: hypothetical protein P1V20_28390 [Verrucomicrobiales bacterium]|nr:hypothetical protein [Verrucomicrobiales bacterium]
MDRALAWFLFILFFIVASLAAAEILNDLQRKTPLVNLADLPQDDPEQDDAASDLWFESRSRENKADLDMKNANLRNAFSELDQAIEIMETLRDDHPGFRPSHSEDRLHELREKKNSWEQGIKSAETPVSSNAPAVDDPGIELPAIGSLAGNSYPQPAIGDFTIGAPRIGSSGAVPESAGAAIQWDNEESRLSKNLAVMTIGEPPVPPLITATLAAVKADQQKAAAELKRSNSDPSSLWYRAYSYALEATELEAKGDQATARKKYEESKACYDMLNQKFPNFESEHIKNGSELLAAKLSKLSD